MGAITDVNTSSFNYHIKAVAFAQGTRNNASLIPAEVDSHSQLRRDART